MIRTLRPVAALVTIMIAVPAPANATDVSVIDLSGAPGLVNVKERIPDLEIDFRYATERNFLGKNVYGNFKTCWMVERAAAMLRDASRALEAHDGTLTLRVFDCLRPRRVQKIFWEAVKGTKQQHYVANPNTRTGSIHNYGCAVDLTIATRNAKVLDMGTDFDHFGPLAEPRYEPKHLAEGRLSHLQVANRLLLRQVMVGAGFYPIANEWWHFNCATAREARRRFPIVE